MLWAVFTAGLCGPHAACHVLPLRGVAGTVNRRVCFACFAARTVLVSEPPRSFCPCRGHSSQCGGFPVVCSARRQASQRADFLASFWRPVGPSVTWLLAPAASPLSTQWSWALFSMFIGLLPTQLCDAKGFHYRRRVHSCARKWSRNSDVLLAGSAAAKSADTGLCVSLHA